MALSFHLTETMSGLHRLIDDAATERAWGFRVTWGSPLVTAARSALARTPIPHAFKGVVWVDGVTDGEVPCTGTLLLDYPGGRIDYELTFDVGGVRHKLRAEKRGVDLRRPLALAKTHTTAYGEVRRGDAVVAAGVLHFAPEALGPFLRSFRFATRTPSV